MLITVLSEPVVEKNYLLYLQLTRWTGISKDYHNNQRSLDVEYNFACSDACHCNIFKNDGYNQEDIKCKVYSGDDSVKAEGISTRYHSREKNDFRIWFEYILYLNIV